MAGGTVEALRQKAERAALALRDAESKAQEAADAARERNAERRTAFWQGVVAIELPAALQALQDARSAFSVAVAEGGDVLGAYMAYAKAHQAHQSIRNAAAGALSWTVNDLGQRHSEPWGRVVYPDGLGKTHHSPDPFLPMFDAASKEAAEQHGQTVVAGLRAPLQAEQESEQ